MYRIIDTRGSGKTSRMMLLAKENNAIFVCCNPNAMEAKARAYGIIGIEFMDYARYLDTMRGNDRKIVIDELEVFLNYMARHNGSKDSLIGYTLTLED